MNPDFSGQAALRWGLGIGLALLTALVLFGGIKRIGAVTEKLIPFMSVAYILMTLIVIFGNLGGVGRAALELVGHAGEELELLIEVLDGAHGGHGLDAAGV